MHNLSDLSLKFVDDLNASLYLTTIYFERELKETKTNSKRKKRQIIVTFALGKTLRHTSTNTCTQVKRQINNY